MRRHRRRRLPVPKVHRDRSASFSKIVFVIEERSFVIEDAFAAAGTDQRSIPLTKQASKTQETSISHSLGRSRTHRKRDRTCIGAEEPTVAEVGSTAS